jgi:hypothetical protein
MNTVEEGAIAHEKEHRDIDVEKGELDGELDSSATGTYLSSKTPKACN